MRKFLELQKKPLMIIGWVLGCLVLGIWTAGLLLPSQYRLEAQWVIDRPRNHVWNRFVEVSQWQKWDPNLQSVERFSDLSEGAGSKRRYVYLVGDGKKLVSDVLVTRWEPGRVYEEQHVSDVLDGKTLPFENAKIQIEFHSEDQNFTRVMVNGSFEVHGVFQKYLTRWVLKPRMDRMIDYGVKNFKQFVEKKAQNLSPSIPA